MANRFGAPFVALALFGALAVLLALLSIGDLALPRAWDGVVLESDAPGTLLVREVVADSGGDRAGLMPGDRILGIDRDVLRSPKHAAALLARRKIGETVPYLVRRADRLKELRIELGRRYLADGTYLYACLLGFLFFGVGAFVLSQQPRQRAAQLFFLVSSLFLLFLVCRLRPASYSWIDRFALNTGTAALLLLPAAFLHFFMVFPRPVSLRPNREAEGYRWRRRLWLATLAYIYVLPPFVLITRVALANRQGREVHLISGAPADNWYVMAVYMVVGLAVLALGIPGLDDARERRGAGLVLFGSVLGLLPFLGATVAFPTLLHTERFLILGLAPLILVPVTFAIAIVRFGLLDIRVILRKSLAYSVLTATITLGYAFAITLFNLLTRGSALADSPYFPFIFALAIAVLFEPLRRRSQRIVDRLLFAERSHLQLAIRELGDAMSAQLDLQTVVGDLVERLPRLLGLRFAALYLPRDGGLGRFAGANWLPEELPRPEVFDSGPAERARLIPIDEIRKAEAEWPEIRELVGQLEAAGVELVGDLSTPRRRIGIAVFSGSEKQLQLDEEELGLLSSLLGQAALALETGLLVEERTRQAELERELEIAATVQNQLLPDRVSIGAGWRVAAACLPARHVGGDFFAELPAPRNGAAVVYGDVAGKSISGALVMMAAHEALQTLALTNPDPATLFGLANQRLYRLGPKKSFVAAAWIAASENGEGIDYVLAGQPQLLRRTVTGGVELLALPEHRLPLGALLNGGFEVRHAPLAPGEVVVGCSDGVLEAQAPDGEQFGDKRLEATLAASPPDPESVVRSVLDAVRAFSAGTEPYDDITLVAIARDPEVAR